MTLFEAQTGGAFDRLNWQHSGEFDQNFSKKSNARGFARAGGGGGMGGFGIDRYINDESTQTLMRISFMIIFRSHHMELHLSEDGHHVSNSFAFSDITVLRSVRQGLHHKRLVQQTQGTR